MLSEQTIQRYRRMSLRERWSEFARSMQVMWTFLSSLPDWDRRRRFRVAALQHAQANRRVGLGLARRT
jgi:hypothetical protein